MNKVHFMGIENDYLLFNKLLSLQLNEFPQSEVKQKFSSIQKITYITAIADKKIISVFCVSMVFYSPPQPAVQIK